MVNSERICYIHIGTHKTGTTSLQVFLASNHERFATYGAGWPTAGGDGDQGAVAHHRLARELNQQASDQHVVLDDVSDELRRSGLRIAILSSEDFTFLWDKPTKLVHLRDAIRAAGFMPRILVYLRPQASYCTAVYTECVRHGYRTPFTDYLRSVLATGQYLWGDGTGPPFDFDRLLEPFATVFGADAIVARRYYPNAADGSLFSSFTDVILPPSINATTFTIPTTRYNGSLDFSGVLRELGSNQAPAERLRFTPLTVFQTLRIRRRFRKSNARLAVRYGVVLPAVEALDFVLSLPIRRSLRKMSALAGARRALATCGDYPGDV